MAMQQAPILDTDTTASTGGLMGTLASLAITAVAIAGIGLWQAGHRGSEQAAPAAVPSAPVVRPAASAGGSAPWYQQAGDGPTWYLVGSRAQAEEADEALSYRNKAFLLEGRPLPEAQVIVVESPLAAQRIRVAAGDEQAVRATGGAPALRLVDLRAEHDVSTCGIDALAPAC